MASIKAYIYEADYVLDDEKKPIIRLFGRTPEGEKICAIDRTFEAFFYVYAEGDLTKIRKELEKLSNDEAIITRTEIITKNLKGKQTELIKVCTHNPSAVPLLRDHVREVEGVIDRYEADILFARRYLLDKNIIPLELSTIRGEFLDDVHYHVDKVIEIQEIITETGNTFENPKILAFDIETYNQPGRYSNAKNDPIMTIALYGQDYTKVISWKRFPTEDETYMFVTSEAELITTFIEIIQDYQPDYITGYFTDGFDLPYIRDRAKKHNISLSLGVDGSTPKFSKGAIKEAHIAGIPHLDVTPFIRHVMKDSLKTDSYGLGQVAQELLGETKLEIEHEKMGITWDEGGKGLEYICEYNLQDSKITYNLTKKILENISELARLIRQNIHDVTRMTTGQLAEWYVIKSAIEENIVIPNKPEQSEASFRRMQTFQGAYVFDPTPGVYENIVVFDFRSLYPSIIIAHNVDPGSLTYESNDAHITPPLEEDGRTIQYAFSKEEAFIPRLLKDLIERRSRIKEMLKQQDDKILNARSTGLKLITNSIYGLFGFFGARWYSNECAAAITSWGRYYIQHTAEKATQDNFLVLYGDTDSIMLGLNGKTREDALSFAKKINKELPEAMELELEDFYPRGIFVSVKGGTEGAKKKYAFINDNKKLKIKGFEAIRRDWSMLARETQREVLRIVLEENDREKALHYTKNIIKELRTNTIPLKELIIKTQIRKDIDSYESIGPHVKVAERMKQLGMPVGIGTLIEYVIVEGKGPLRDKAKLPEECQDGEYDSEYYINNQIIPAVQNIFEATGYAKEDIVKEKGQSSLNDFF